MASEKYAIIDAHIHLDLYTEEEQEQILSSLAEERVEALVSVAKNLFSCRELLRLKQLAPTVVYPAFGFHPEQPLPDEAEIRTLMEWIREHHEHMVAIGEVGLPYYRRKEAERQGESFELKPYIRLLRQFIELAVERDKPIVLHAIYDDAELACDLLEQCGCMKAHFHWFKGEQHTLERMMEAGYYISIAPDVAMEPEIQQIVMNYPLSHMMVETDGPWKFSERMTHPADIRASVARIAALKKISEVDAANQLYHNTRLFYQLP